MTVCIVVKLLNQGLFSFDVKKKETVLSPFINFSFNCKCAFSEHLLAGTDSQIQFFLFFVARKTESVCSADNKFLRNLHLFVKVMKSGHWKFFFAVPSSVNVFNSRNSTGKRLCKNGGIRGQGYGTCRFMSCHHNILNGLMKVKTKLGFIHKKTYTTDREKNDKKREDMSWYFLFSLFIYRISLCKKYL